MKKTINTVLIGLGNIGYEYDIETKNIQTHFKAINNNKNYNLKMVIDTDIKKIKSFKNRFNYFAKSNVKKKYFSNIDLVVLAVPTYHQYKIFKKIINLGYNKNFLVEKPFIVNKNKLKEISKKNKKHKFFINYYRNYDDKLIKYLQIMSKNKKLKIEVKYSKGFLHNFSHYLNLFIKIFGKIENIQFIKRVSLKDDFVANGIIKFKKLNISFKNIPDNKDSSFIVLKDKEKIFHYKNDGLKILNKKKNGLKPNYNYMSNVYTNIYKTLNKTKSNFYDIDSHKVLLENLVKFI